MKKRPLTLTDNLKKLIRYIHRQKMKFNLLFGILLFLTYINLFPQDVCKNAVRNAKTDFQKSEYSLHSAEFLPVENTSNYVLRKYFNIQHYFTDSLDYYHCYDSVMLLCLKEKFGDNFLDRVQHLSDSLEKTDNWINDPHFPGGQDELFKFIYTRINSANIKPVPNKTRLQIKFLIDTLGYVNNPIVIRGINRRTDKKVVEIIKQLPKFEPGYLFGKPIKQWYTIPINLEYQ